MTSTPPLRLQGMDERMARLRPFVGEWRLETSFGPPGAVRAVAVFEETLGGAFLVERSEVDLPEAPNGLSIIAPDPEGDGYLQHYFDDRGVVRLYRMTFDGRVWTLLRDQPDFSPLDFAQRYTGTLSEDGGTITGRWEIRHPGQDWTTDFELSYVREP